MSHVISMIEKVLSKVSRQELKERAYLFEKGESVMGHTNIVDDVIKDGIRKLIADNPSKVYLRTYLESVL